MKIITNCFLSLILIYQIIFAQSKNFINTNFRIYPSITTQTEVLIKTHPIQPNILFCSANAIQYTTGFFMSEGIYVSTDAGKTWRGTDTCNGPIIQFHGGDPAITIDKNGTFILTHLGRVPFDGMYSHYSTDLGLNWSYQYLISSNTLERANLDSDVNPNSPYYGKSYCVWVELTPPYPLRFSSTSNGGVEWSNSIAINNPTQRCAGGEIALDENSNIYTTWAVLSNSSPYTEIFAGFASSSNGGAIWNIKENAISIRGIQGILDFKGSIRVNGYPKIDIDRSNSPFKGSIYIITTQKNNEPAGSDPDIIMYKSTDRGATFSSGIRVNQDQINNGKTQYFPAIHVDNEGGINIIYYDDRNTSSDSTGLFLSRSTNGGLTFNDYEISDHNFKPAALSGNGQGYQGDNIGITSSNNILIPVWMDNSSGIYQIWSSLIDFKLLNVDSEIKPSEIVFTELNLYPNPFNSQAKVTFKLKNKSNVKLDLYDLIGNLQANLVNDYFEKGEYHLSLDSEKLNLTSGIYFIRLTTESNIISKKIMLIK